MKQILQIVFRTAFGSTWRNDTGRICCIRTWKSCAFILWSLRSFIDTLFIGFELYPSGTVNVNKTWKIISFSFFERVCGAGERNIFFPFFCGQSDLLEPNYCKSSWQFFPSFDLSFIFRRVPKILLHTFFFYVHYI